MIDAPLHIPPDLQPWLATQITAAAYQGMRYRCTGCDQPGYLGDGGPPVAAQIQLYGSGQYVVKIVHQGCGPTGIVSAAPDQAAAMPAELSAEALPVVTVSPFATAPWPAILVEVKSSVHRLLPADQHGDRNVDELIAAACEAGLQPVANIAFPPEPPDPRWRVHLPGPGEPGAIRGPDGLVLFEPLQALRWPPEFAPAVAQRDGHCAVYQVSGVGLTTPPFAGSTPDHAMQMINTAALDGRVVGLIARVHGLARTEPTR